LKTHLVEYAKFGGDYITQFLTTDWTEAETHLPYEAINTSYMLIPPCNVPEGFYDPDQQFGLVDYLNSHTLFFPWITGEDVLADPHGSYMLIQ
jgi:hypothetical protein